MTVDDAVQIAITELSKNPHAGNNGYALTYLKAIDQAVAAFPHEPEHAKQVQILYALGNMQSWRGETAKQVKSVLKSYAAPGTGRRR